MTWIEAIVWIFAMFFGVIFFGILSHHVLEKYRLERGYYDEKRNPSSSPVPFN